MKQYSTTLFVLILLAFASNLSAQNWKSHYRLAEKKQSLGEYYDAGYHYEAAYRVHHKRKIAFKAAEAYYSIKDFRRAANMYSKILEYEKKYPMVRLKYARCLKQSRQYDKAIREFVVFISHYKGRDKATWDDIVDKEIEGCALGISYSDAGSGLLKIEHLPKSINSNAIEMAPIPISDDILYFTSVKNGRGTFLRSDKEGGDWGEPIIPESFPKIDGQHFGSGTLSTDHRRFYFTGCQNTDGLRAKCRIYVTVRKSDSWSEPQVLADYINWPDATTTQPYVTAKGGKELLFFASNRDGGKGGLDIYVAERDLTSKAFDFSFPRNLGDDVNTLGDEQTPFYSTEEEALYFSSNGHVSIGGQDIFKSIGTPKHFAEATNLGAPINSAADDLFFVKSPDGNNGYIVSNRIFGNQKITTTDEDIFAFNFSPNQFMLTGYVLDGNHKVVKHAEVALYEENGNGELIYLTGKSSNDGTYKFPIRANKNYVVEIEKEGFPVRETRVNTFGQHKDLKLIKDIVLTEVDAYETVAAVNSLPKTNIGTAIAYEDVKTKGPAKQQNYAVGTVFKIQLSSSSLNSDLHHRKYGRIKNLGEIEKNYIPARDVYWIMLGDYANFKEAVKSLAKVKNRGFSDAYIVKYTNGERVGAAKVPKK